MNDSHSKLRNSMAEQNGKMQQGGGNSGNGKQANGPARGGKTGKKRNLILPILLIMVGCAVFLFAAWSAVNSPVLASILSLSSAPQQVQRGPVQSFAQVNIAKPTYTPAALQPVEQPLVLQAIQPTATITSAPVAADTSLPEMAAPALDAVILPTDTLFIESATATPAPELASEPGVISAEIIPDTPTSEYAAPPAAVANVPAAVTSYSGERWIDVNLSEQRVYAYEGDTVVNSFIVSTGTWQTPTVTGKYKIWIKVRIQDMSGPGYYLPDVPYVMYFYKGYGFHGTYWHNNFGTPMSRGCVNLTIPDAEWLYNFSQVGTVVNVHY